MRILFFSPSGNRTGSEVVLWHLMNQLIGNQIEIAIYTKEKGPLFSKESPTKNVFQHPWNRGFLYQIFETIIHKLTGKTPEQWYVQKIHQKFKPDFWYLNTISMPEFATLAIQLKIPYLLHVHEMISVFDTLRADGFSKMINNASMVIAGSKAVDKQFKEMGIKNIKLIQDFIDTEKIAIKTPPSEIKIQLGIPTNAYVWLMAGSICMRKGIDFVPDLLNLLPQNTYLVWLGSASEYSAYYYVTKRVELEHLNFVVVGSKGGNDYYDYLNLCDGFVLLSREEPFGLVMADAAYLEKPIVAFESGGPNDFIEEGMGKVVKSFDLYQMAQEMIAIMNNETIIDRQKLKNKASEYDVKKHLSQWLEIIETLSLN